MSNRKQSGFTLIELVMVIVIIGVLSAIIVPNFVDYVGKSAASTTKANLQMLRSAIQAYRSENSSQSPKRLDTLIPLYLPELPEDGVKERSREIDPPANGDGGWIYDRITGNVRPNLFGNDAYGISFSDY